jgi:hypothetical protein
MDTVKSPSVILEPVELYLEGVAKHLVDRIWGPNGPEWGTKLSTVEDVAVLAREIISKKMTQIALERQAAEDVPRPTEYLDCPSCGGPTEYRDPEPRILDTRAGEVAWQEPHRYCSACRRAFFPSVEKSGD